MIGLLTLAGLTQCLSPSQLPVVAGVALATGLSLPPVAPVLRSAVPGLAPSEEEAHRTLAWEATYQELIFVGGPPIALGVAALTTAATSLALLGVTAGAGTSLFAMVLRHQRMRHALPTTRDAGAHDPAPGHLVEDLQKAPFDAGSPGGVPPRFAIARLAFTYGLMLSTLTAMTLLAVTVAVEAGRPAIAGVLEANLAVGSMIGGSLAARGRMDHLTLAARMTWMAAVLSAVSALCTLTSSLVATGCALAAAGFWVAPSLAVQGVAVLRIADPTRRAEVFGWVNAVGLGVNAAMTPLTGWLLDLHGPGAGAALGAASVVLGGTLAKGLTNGYVRRRLGS